MRSQPTRVENTETNPSETTQERSTGASHVGRCAIDANVSFGLKSAPKMRLMELLGLPSGVAGAAAIVLAINSPSHIAVILSEVFRQFYRDTKSKNPASSFRHLTTQPCAVLFRAVYSRMAL